MTSSEHSTLVLLCQSIEAFPESTSDLCFLALDGKERSEDFIKMVQVLQNASDLAATIKAAQETRSLLKK